MRNNFLTSAPSQDLKHKNKRILREASPTFGEDVTKELYQQRKKSNTRSLAQIIRQKGKNGLRNYYASNYKQQANTSSSLSWYTEGIKVKQNSQHKYKKSKKCVPVKHFKKKKDLDTKHKSTIDVYSLKGSRQGIFESNESIKGLERSSSKKKVSWIHLTFKSSICLTYY